MIPQREEHEDKYRSQDRVLILKPIPGKTVKDSTGSFDPRLFNGDNRLHAVQNNQNMSWSFKYDAGGLPESLKQKFTSFSKCLDHARIYYSKRNVDIVEVID